MKLAVARPVASSWTSGIPCPHQVIRELLPLNRYANRSPL